MSAYTSKYTGEQIDEAVEAVLGGGVSLLQPFGYAAYQCQKDTGKEMLATTLDENGLYTVTICNDASCTTDLLYFRSSSYAHTSVGGHITLSTKNNSTGNITITSNIAGVVTFQKIGILKVPTEIN